MILRQPFDEIYPPVQIRLGLPRLATNAILSPMSLPPGFVDELRQRLSLSQVVGRKVTWDTKKSNTAKGDYWSPCPFHQEKTASFHVDDRKGFYYCFGCHQKGDAIGFVRETENVGFIEAIELLAREAGMTMPARDPQAQQKYDHNKVLYDLMEQAVQYYRLQLKTAAGQDARDYIERRGLTDETQNTFEIGFAPNNRNGVTQHLIAKGFKEDAIVEAGMAIKPDDGRAAYDRFRDRIMFPIRDPQNRAIAFGGRAMSPDAPAKYLNSPETPLFDKGRTLYNHGPARAAAGKSEGLIVAEGYMDVIALAQAGFTHAVAPLGTAITENQLTMLWRIWPEPVIALDGDKAGIRAAYRLIDLSLPLLEAGKSLRFVILPDGQDPDDLIKADGAGAMQTLLAGALPTVDLVWRREIEGKVFDSPERRASLDADLRSIILKIQDKNLRSHYGQAIAAMRRELFTPNQNEKTWQPRAKWKGGRPPEPSQPMPDTKASFLGRASDETPRQLREAVILAAAILAPEAAEANETRLEKCAFSTRDFVEIQNALLANLHRPLSDEDGIKTLADQMEEGLGFAPLARLRQIKRVADHPYLQAQSKPDMIERTLSEELDKHAAILGTNAEIKEAEQDLEGLADEGVTWRLQQAAQSRVNAVRGDSDKDEANASAEEQSLSEHLQTLLDDQVWVKKKS